MSMVIDRLLTLARDDRRLDAFQEKLTKYRDDDLQYLFDKDKRAVIKQRRLMKKSLKKAAWKYMKRLMVASQQRPLECSVALREIIAQDYALEPAINEGDVNRLHVYIRAAADKNDERRWENDGDVRRHGHVIVDMFTNKVIYLRLPNQPTIDDDGHRCDYRQAIKI